MRKPFKSDYSKEIKLKKKHWVKGKSKFLFPRLIEEGRLAKKHKPTVNPNLKLEKVKPKKSLIEKLLIKK